VPKQEKVRSELLITFEDMSLLPYLLKEECMYTQRESILTEQRIEEYFPTFVPQYNVKRRQKVCIYSS